MVYLRVHACTYLFLLAPVGACIYRGTQLAGNLAKPGPHISDTSGPERSTAANLHDWCSERLKTRKNERRRSLQAPRTPAIVQLFAVTSEPDPRKATQFVLPPSRNAKSPQPTPESIDVTAHVSGQHATVPPCGNAGAGASASFITTNATAPDDRGIELRIVNKDRRTNVDEQRIKLSCKLGRWPGAAPL